MTIITDEKLEEKGPRVRRSGVAARALRQPLTVVFAAILMLIITACALAPWIAPYDPLYQDLTAIYQEPSAAHWLGTDQLGRDIQSRLMFGGRVTLLGALQAVVVYTALGVILGIVAGSLGGRTESIIMRICDFVQSVPGLVILLVILAIFGQSESAAMLTLGILLAPGLIRIVRGETRSVRGELYVAAGRVAGLSTTQLQTRHILPAVTGPVLTQVSVVAGLAILTEASIGFLGLGIAPPDPSWGNMITDAQRAIVIDPWMLVPTGGVIVLVSLSLTLLGIGIRDAYAGRSAGRLGQLSWRAMAARVHRGQKKLEPVGTPGPGEVLLSVRGMSIELPGGDGPVTVVDNVSMDVGSGEAIGIVGESGCGKSMTVTGILRVLPAGGTLSADSITFAGTDLLGLSEKQISHIRGSGIAYISQEPISSLDPVFTAGQQLSEAVRAHRKVSRKASRTIALELLKKVRLPNPEEVAGKYPHELSGGMAQRVAIARALAGEPKLLIADEPTTALDVTVQAEILDLLKDLREQTGMALILVTHDWGVLADACDRALVMYAGQVVEQAPLKALVALPAHPYSRALLLSTPSNIEPGELLPVISGTVPPPGAWPQGCRFAARCEFARDDCTSAPITLHQPAPDQLSRCIHVDDLRRKEVQHGHVSVG